MPRLAGPALPCLALPGLALFSAQSFPAPSRRPLFFGTTFSNAAARRAAHDAYDAHDAPLVSPSFPTPPLLHRSGNTHESVAASTRITGFHIRETPRAPPPRHATPRTPPSFLHRLPFAFAFCSTIYSTLLGPSQSRSSHSSHLPHLIYNELLTPNKKSNNPATSFLWGPVLQGLPFAHRNRQFQQYMFPVGNPTTGLRLVRLIRLVRSCPSKSVLSIQLAQLGFSSCLAVVCQPIHQPFIPPFIPNTRQNPPSTFQPAFFGLCRRSLLELLPCMQNSTFSSPPPFGVSNGDFSCAGFSGPTLER